MRLHPPLRPPPHHPLHYGAMVLVCAGLLAGAAAAVSAADIIECPEGASPRGAAPPTGREIRCEKPDGTPHGLWVTWYESGGMMSRRQMRDGVEHGQQESWWPHGGRMMRGVSVHGSRYQGFEYWSPGGEPMRMELETETVGPDELSR